MPPYARLAARLLKREVLPDAQPPPDAVRSEAVAAIERALVARARARRWRRATAAGLGLAASVGLVFAARGLLGTAPQPYAQRNASVPASSAPSSAFAPQPQDIVVRVSGPGRVTGQAANGALREPGGRVQLQPAGQALLAFQTGTRIALEGGADFTLVQNAAAQVFSLGRGALRADVAKLAPGRRFLVHTPDAEVEVHGTSFRVVSEDQSVRCGDDSHTQVEVFEGVVTVRHAGIEHRIEKGGRWPEACAGSDLPPVAAATTEASVHARAPGTPSRAAVVPAPHTPAPALAPASSLVEQNDAFAAAMAARHAGDLERADRGFARLLARFPDGPLAESAAVQQMKVVRELDPTRAAQLARAYLERYPAGFARDHAEQIAAELP